jgi:hypothetical protein
MMGNVRLVRNVFYSDMVVHGRVLISKVALCFYLINSDVVVVSVVTDMHVLSRLCSLFIFYGMY